MAKMKYAHARSKTEKYIDRWPEKPSRQTKVGLGGEKNEMRFTAITHSRWEVMCGEVATAAAARVDGEK